VASVTVSREDLFPNGTSVAAYAAAGTGRTPSSGAPAGSSVDSGTVSGGSVTLSGLTEETVYILYASSPDRYLRVLVPTSEAAQSGSDETVNTVASTGAAETIPAPTTASVNYFTLDANCTLTFPTAAAGRSFTLVLKQDAIGSRTVTWPGTVQWADGSAPTLTTTANKRDAFTFLCVDGTNWLAFVAGQDF
jgi:hypothetical protein